MWWVYTPSARNIIAVRAVRYHRTPAKKSFRKMLSTLLPYISLEVATSKSVSGLLAEATGYSPRYFRGRTRGPKTPSGRQRLLDRSQEKSIKTWCDLGFPERMVRDWLSGFDRSAIDKRLLEHWLLQLNSPDPLLDLSATFELAKEIDELSAIIGSADAQGDPDQVKALLTGEPRILRFNRPSVIGRADISPTQYLTRVQRIDTQAEWREYANVLILNASMALLAQLDKETTAQYFPSFVPRHSFRLVTPIAQPNINQSGSTGKASFEIRIPPRRLLDLFACVAHRLEHGTFPETVPTMSEFALQAFDMDDEDPSATRRLGRWRRGEVPLTHLAIQELWEGINTTLETAGQPSNNAHPWPLCVAALTWQRLYVESGRSGIEAVWTIHDDYDYWLSQIQGSIHGDEITEPWPDCFSLI